MAMIEEVEAYIEKHPEVAVIDPLDNVRKLLDRYVSYRVIHDSKLEDIGQLKIAFLLLFYCYSNKIINYIMEN